MLQPGVVKIISDKHVHLVQTNLALPVEGRQLERVSAERTQRLPRVNQAAVLQKANPHFQVHKLAVARVEPSARIGPAKKYGRWLADQVMPFFQTLHSHGTPISEPGPAQIVPDIHYLGVLINDVPSRGGQRGRWIGFDHRHQLAQGLAGRQQVIAAHKLYILPLGPCQATVEILRRGYIERIYLETDATVQSSISLDHGDGVVRRAIVNNQQLKIPELLSQHRFNRLRQVASAIVVGEQNTDFRRIHASPRLVAADAGPRASTPANSRWRGQIPGNAVCHALTSFTVSQKGTLTAASLEDKTRAPRVRARHTSVAAGERRANPTRPWACARAEPEI